MKRTLKIILNSILTILLSLIFFISCKDEPRLDTSKGLTLDSGIGDSYQESYIGDTLVIVLRNLDNAEIEYMDLDFYRIRRGLNNEELSRYQHRFETFYDIGFNETIRFSHFVPDSTTATTDPTSINVEDVTVGDRIDIRFKHKQGGNAYTGVGIRLIKKD